MLFGKENFIKLQKAKILILGVGGVGGYVLDCLYRSGVTDITIIDYDTYDETNQNRQIGSEAIGELKTEVLKKLYPTITAINQKMDMAWVREFNFEPYDLIIDSADTTRVKIELAKKIYKKLLELNPMFLMSKSYAKDEGSFLVFEITFIDGEFRVNSKAIKN